MQEMGLEVKKPQLLAEHKKPIPRAVFKNRLERQFDQMQPNLVWVSDVTYAKVGETYYFICVILDHALATCFRMGFPILLIQHS